MSNPRDYNASPRVLRYSRHAEQRLQERKISKSDAEEAYRNPDVTHPDDKGNPCYVKHFPGGRRVEIVVRAGSDPPFVITVMD
jgi:hypothetical protein